MASGNGTTDIDVDPEKLIALIEVRPVVWDRTLEIYKEKYRTLEAWKEICKLLYPDYDSLPEGKRKVIRDCVLKKWTHMRDSWMKSYRKLNEKRNSVKTSRKYIYYEPMSFLKKVARHRNGMPGLAETAEETSDSKMEISAGSQLNNSECLNHATRKTKERQPEEEEAGIPKTHPSGLNRHLSFFQGVLPSLQDLNDDETIDFQMGVLNLIKSIKKNRSFPAKNSS